MERDERKALVESAKGLKLNGYCCHVAGYAHEYAGVAPCTGGFYETTWEAVKEVMASESKDFNQVGIWKTGSGWLGYGCVPDWRMCQEEWYKKNRMEVSDATT